MCDQSAACVAYPSSRLQARMRLSPTLSLPLSAIDLDKETPFPKQHDAIRFAFQRSLRHDAARFFRPSPCEPHQGISFRSFSRLFPSLSCQQPRLAEPSFPKFQDSNPLIAPFVGRNPSLSPPEITCPKCLNRASHHAHQRWSTGCRLHDAHVTKCLNVFAVSILGGECSRQQSRM